MGRYSYDDMPPEGYRENRGSRSRMSAFIALIGVLITLIAIVVYLLFTPRSDAPETDAAVVERTELAVRNPEVIAIPQSTESTASKPVEKADPVVEIKAASDDFSPVEKFSYTISDGDTLQAIASSYGIDVETIVSVNKLTGTDLIEGEVLSIPSVSGVLVTVEDGDTLDTIVRRRNPELSASDLAALNGKADTAVKTGEEIFVPSPGALERPVSRTFSSPLPGGTITAHYREYYNGNVVNGVVIASDPGSAVEAAADGRVIDKSFDKVYGRTVKILHDDGYVTSYSALERIESNITVGTNLERGDVIGAIGTSVRAFPEPALLFSLEQNSVSLDPELLTQF